MKKKLNINVELLINHWKKKKMNKNHHLNHPVFITSNNKYIFNNKIILKNLI